MADPKQDSLMEATNLTLQFGKLDALSDVSIKVGHHELVAMIGPNGAGKTSLLNCLSGYYHPQIGEVYFEGKKINKLPPYARAKLGIARTYQKIELFTGLTTLQNLMAARHMFLRQGALAGGIYFGWAQREELKQRKVVENIIDFLEIGAIRHETVGTLAYGLRKRVELGRALALEPKLLLLDESMAGMNVEEKEDIVRFILDIFEERDVSIVLIEHDMGVVMDIAQRVVVLDFGRKIADGTPAEIRMDPTVVKAYLGAEV